MDVDIHEIYDGLLCNSKLKKEMRLKEKYEGLLAYEYLGVEKLPMFWELQSFWSFYLSKLVWKRYYLHLIKFSTWEVTTVVVS